MAATDTFEVMRGQRTGRWVALSVALCTFLLAPAVASAASSRSSSPYAVFTNGHSYRHGVVPTVGWAAAHRSQLAQSNSTGPLTYGGGNGGVGVTTGAEHVYVVLWGSQWGSESTNGQGYQTFSGDPQRIAPDLQAFFTGLGTGAETWSSVMTQYCQGVPAGAQSCPSNVAHVAYPTGGALAGVWEDSGSAAPTQATANQIAAEAVAAAEHFGNTTAAANRNVQYFIVSPTGADPNRWMESSFCAWHSSTIGLDSTPWGSPIAFTNMPYVLDKGGSCGENAVNLGTAGVDDGVTIVGGHEYAETITDQFPLGGWVDSGGGENGDKCAWITYGQGALQNLSLTTGLFAVQSTWANDFAGGGGCEISQTTHLAITTAPGSASTGGPVTVGVSVEDSNSNVVTSGTGSADSLSLSVASGPANSFSSCSANPVAATAGVATFSCTLDTAGSYTLNATDLTDGTVSSTTTPSFTVSVGGNATQLAVTAEPASINAGSSVSIGISVEDANGNLVTSATGATDSIKLAVSSGPTASLAGCAANPVTASAGMATFSCTINVPGTYTVSATDQTQGSVTTARSSPFTVAAGALAQLVFTSGPVATASAGSTFTVDVTAEDSLGNPVGGVPVTLSLTSGAGPPGANFACGLSDSRTTDELGVAQFACSVDLAGGGYALTAASASPSLSAVSRSFAVAAGAPGQLAFTGEPAGSAPAGSIFPIAVTVRDAKGNAVGGVPVTLSLTPKTGTASAKLSCGASDTATTDSTGVAHFSCSIDRKGSGYTLTATIGAQSLTTTSKSVTVTAPGSHPGAPAVGPSASFTSGSTTIGLSCNGSSSCEGEVVVVERVVRHHFVRRHGRRVRVSSQRTYELGKVHFTLAPGGTAGVHPVWNRKGRALLHRLGVHGITLRLISTRGGASTVLVIEARARRA